MKDRQPILEGSCLCGANRFRVKGPYSEREVCHCSLCRKASGTAFTSTIVTYAENLEWLRQEAPVREYHYSDIYSPHFCSRCGAPVPLVGKAGGCFIPAGSLDTELTVGIRKHIFVASKAPWDEIYDDAPQYEAFSPSSVQSVSTSDTDG